MSTSRTKSKKKAQVQDPAPIPDETPNSPSTSETQATPHPEPSTPSTDSKKTTDRSVAPNPARWSSGSWQGKAAAVAEVAKDSISAAATTASERLPPSTPTQRLSEKLRTSSKSSPTTQVTREDSVGPDSPRRSEEKSKAKDREAREETKDEDGKDDAVDAADFGLKERPLPAAGWRGWWTRPKDDDEKRHEDAKPDDSKNTKASDTSPTVKKTESVTEPSEAEQLPGSKSQGSSSPPPKQHTEEQNTDAGMAAKGDATERKTSQRASWFGLWNSGQSNISEPPPNQKGNLVVPAASNVASDGISALVEEEEAPAEPAETKQDQAQRSGSWAFWSREAAKDGSKHRKNDSKSEPGELAIARTASESNPTPARMTEPENAKSGTSTPAESTKSGKTGTPNETKSKSKAKKKSEPALSESILRTSLPAANDDPGKSADESDDKSLKAAVKKQLPQNLLLPPLQDTLPYEETQTYMQSLWKMFGRQQSEQPRHLILTKHPPKIRKAVAIGVHGYFPAPLIQKVLGQPTGTSLKFANTLSTSIQSWASQTQPTVPLTIEKLALEGEGMIASRVDTLWKLLLNFSAHLQSADLILLAAHSQGVPVSVALLRKLLATGILKSDVRIGVCGMAGINLGPFASYQSSSRILGAGSAAELFDFARPESVVAKQYREDLQACLAAGVRVTYVGSIDDQLVSLESSLHTPVSHPNIYRAIFVDGRIHAPGFVTALVGLAVKLKNLGRGDHGLIREVSLPLAGSLYTGEGHSRIYEDEGVYGLAVEFAVGTVEAGRGLQAPGRGRRASAGSIGQESKMMVEAYEPSGGNANPYLLPWAMRGILGEELVQTRLKGEVEELRRLFDEWKPVTKQLRDVKVRLEGLRARL